MKPNYWLATSSLLLLAPAWAAWRAGDQLRVWYHTGVTLVSVTYHLTKHPVIFWIDIAAANSLVPSILPLVIQRDYVAFAYVIAVAYCAGMFYYGHMKKELVWHPDVDTATPYHISLRWMASFSLALAILVTNSSLAVERSSTPMLH